MHSSVMAVYNHYLEEGIKMIFSVKDLFHNGPKDVSSGHPFTQSRQELEERVLTITVGKL